jgi:DNA mismatch repair protein MutS
LSTPIRQQYLQIKRQYPDTILFFRLGDFYETFDADAELVSREVNIVLTSRPIGKGQNVPLAGVPYHAVETYMAKLISKGYKVALCEQLGTEPVKGLVPREVVRVVTPGTVVEPSLLDDRANNYLACVYLDGDRCGLAYADITTGEFATTQFDDTSGEVRRIMVEELARLRPAECVLPEAALEEIKRWRLEADMAVHLSPYDGWHFDYDNASRALRDHFAVASLAGFGCEGSPLAVQAAGALIQYLLETQKSAVRQLTGLATYTISEFMTLDSATRRNLELTQTLRSGAARGSLLNVLDKTVTPMGARLLRRWLNQPLLDVARLEARLDAVQTLTESAPARSELVGLLKGVSDLERLSNRVVQGIASPRDLLGIARSLEGVPRAIEVLGDLAVADRDALRRVGAALDPCAPARDLIVQAIAAPMSDHDRKRVNPMKREMIRPGFSPELDHIIAASKDAKTWVAGLESRERQRTGIRNLKVGFNKVFGYYLEVTNANSVAVPAEYIRKQTLVNAERYITPDLKEYESLILNAEEQIAAIEGRVFREVCQQVAAYASRLVSTARALAEIDVYIGLVEVALLHRYVRPRLDDEGVIAIRNGRHPVVELTLHDEPFVPNDVLLSDDEQIHIITGPNMSGKSTFLRQTAIIVLMAQIGSFVPADDAQIGLVDRIFTRIGAQDEIAAGQSTFMVEMVETANILNHATRRSLIVLDELGRGTSTYDGISIAWAVAEYIHNHPRLRAKTLFATHYHELIDLAKRLPRVRNYNVSVTEEGDHVVFLRRIVPGGADRSYGIHVAQLAGLPRPVIHRAEEILADLEGGRAQREVAPSIQVQQLTLFSMDDPIKDELKTLDVDSMSPLEALNKLYDLHRRASDTERR